LRVLSSANLPKIPDSLVQPIQSLADLWVYCFILLVTTHMSPNPAPYFEQRFLYKVQFQGPDLTMQCPLRKSMHTRNTGMTTVGSLQYFLSSLIAMLKRPWQWYTYKGIGFGTEGDVFDADAFAAAATRPGARLPSAGH
jgi:hypothetical protein